MQAIVYDRYGPPDVLYPTEVEKPVPADDQVLIKIHAVSINGSDREALRYLVEGHAKGKVVITLR